MNRSLNRMVLLVAAIVAAGIQASGSRASEPWPWMESNAIVLPNGDLQYAPKPFVFQSGASVRYIDFENGADTNDGSDRNAPWKHHPWDPAATGNAAATSGTFTYVFKRGVIYRGQLLANASGQEGDPIRLTSDPSWGTGEACLYGSEAVTGWTQGPTGVNASIPSPGLVWYQDVNFLPRLVCAVAPDGTITRLKLARQPNWEITDPLNPYKDCWAWDSDRTVVTVNGTQMYLCKDSMLNNPDPNYYIGGLVWSEYGNLMSAPYAAPIEGRVAAQNGIEFQDVRTGTTSSYFVRHYQHYWIEDKPQYLDVPGEYWFEKTGDTSGRLYVRLPGDADPATMQIEAGHYTDIITKYQGTWNHIDISGLTFRFVTPNWRLDLREDQDYPNIATAAIHFEGTGTDLTVRNCKFEYMVDAIRFRAHQVTERLDNITVCDNDIAFTDHGAIAVLDGTLWNQGFKPGSLGNVTVLRNRIRDTGLRPTRWNGHHTLQVAYPETAEISGNFLERVGGAGIFVFGGKQSTTALTQPWDAPFNRILIHHNKVVNALLASCDWGSIENWQGGPFYVYDNVSVNPVGQQSFASTRFCGVYYLDGAFKSYHFNNIGYGADVALRTGNVPCPVGFMETIGYQNAFFNNTLYNLSTTGRRQEADPGRNQYLGNIFDSSRSIVFDHNPYYVTSTPVYELFAYDKNVVSRMSGRFGAFEPSGPTYATLADYANALNARQALCWNTGVQTSGAVLMDAAGGDFRPKAGSPAIDSGVKYFVPWALYMTVGEWSFVPNRKTPSLITDEHWYMEAHWAARDDYWTYPMYPLTGTGISASDFTGGPLEDWTQGALNLNGTTQYLSLANVTSGFDPQIASSNFLIEAVLRMNPGQTSGLLIGKTDADAGYRVDLCTTGSLVLTMKSGGVATVTVSHAPINDGAWHHVIVEADRVAGHVTFYVDGAAEPFDVSLAGSLANTGDLTVGQGLAGTLDFLRISLGTLADARTTIGELRAWEFDGPFLRDFAGNGIRGARRDAGALELLPPASTLMLY